MTFFELDDEDHDLLTSAADALSRLASTRVASVALVRGGSGQVYVGCELRSHGERVSAELIALGSALAGGETDISAVVAIQQTAGGPEVITPCGTCRQFFLDYAPDAAVIVQDSGIVMKVFAEDLLPLPRRQ